VIGDARLCLEGLSARLADFVPGWERAVSASPPPAATPDGGPDTVPPSPAPAPEDARLTARDLFALVAQERPDDSVVVQEVPSSIPALMRHLKFSGPGRYFTMASGGLGFGLPAAVGLALAERDGGRGWPVLAFIGDGSLHYSVQALWSAAQLGVRVVVVVPRNGEYGILKMFARRRARRACRAWTCRAWTPCGSRRGTA